MKVPGEVWFCKLTRNVVDVCVVDRYEEGGWMEVVSECREPELTSADFWCRGQAVSEEEASGIQLLHMKGIHKQRQSRGKRRPKSSVIVHLEMRCINDTSEPSTTTSPANDTPTLHSTHPHPLLSTITHRQSPPPTPQAQHNPFPSASSHPTHTFNIVVSRPWA